MSDLTNAATMVFPDPSTGPDVLSPATSLVQQLTEVSPPVAMALVLAVLYVFAISQTSINKLILDLLVVGGAAALYPELADPGKVGFAVHNPIAAEVVTGALIGTAAIVASPMVRRVLIKLGVLSDPATKTINEKAVTDSPPKPPVSGPSV